MAVGLFVWAIAERSKGLLTVSLVFLVAAISTSLYDFENVVPFVAWDVYWQYTLLPNLALCAFVLLVSSAIYAVIERRDRTIA